MRASPIATLLYSKLNRFNGSKTYLKQYEKTSVVSHVGQNRFLCCLIMHCGIAPTANVHGWDFF